MNKNIYIFGAFAFMFAVVGLPAAAVHAQDVATSSIDATATSAQQVKQQVAQIREQAKQQVELLSAQAKQKIEQAQATAQEARGLASSSAVTALKEQTKQQVGQVREVVKNSIELMRESTTTPAQSLEQLKQLIEERKVTIKDEAASTTVDTRKILEDVAPMRVAVHALLAARDLLGEKGGIGQQVSDIAQKMNDSVATTTNAEAKIQSRGFFSKLFFGGDKNAADTLTQQVNQNQTHLQTLAGLIASASTTAEVKSTLEAQVQAMTAEQSRLKDVAQSQSKLWGLFSWRLF